MTEFQIPKPGTTITLTTRYRDYYYFSDKKWKDTTYARVTVLRPQPWFSKTQFAVASDDPRIQYHVIDIGNVVDITPGTRVLSARVDDPSDFSNQRTNNMAKTSLNWNQRFALIDHYKPSDAQICSAFGVDQNQLDTARQLRTSGQFVASTDLDVDSYSSMFSVATNPTKTSAAGSTSVVKPTTDDDDAPITATKRPKVAKKRGRKGDKIKNAFAAIPTTATPAEAFAKQHDVSLTVLRQGKRFDPQQDSAGKVHVKKIAQTEGGDKVLCIWRDK